jgi:O-antigen/teichoic acid export membrane protein
MPAGSLGSERPTFLSGFLSVGAAHVCTLAGALVTTAILARHLPTDAFGAFLLIQALALILARFCSFGLDLAVPRFLSEEGEARRRFAVIGSVFAFRLTVVAVVGVAALLVLTPAAGLFGLEKHAGLLPFLPWLLGLQSLGGLLTAVLQGLFLFPASARAHAVASTAHVLAIVVLVPGLHLGVHAVAWAKVGTLALGLAVGLLAVPVRQVFRWDASLLRQILRFSLPLQLNDILGYAAQRLDAVVVAALLGPAAVVYLEVARRLPEGVSTIYEAFRSVFFPFAAGLAATGRLPALVLLLNRALRLVAFVTLLATLLALLYGEEVIRLLFSRAYVPSAPLFALLMLGLSFTVLEHTMGYSLVAVGETGKPVILNAVRSSLNLAGLAALIPLAGILGPGVALVLSAALTLPLPVRFLAQRGVRVSWSTILMPAAVFALCAGLYYFLGSVIARPVILLVFGTGSLLLGVLGPQDLAFWRDSHRWDQPHSRGAARGRGGRQQGSDVPAGGAEVEPVQASALREGCHR